MNTQWKVLHPARVHPAFRWRVLMLVALMCVSSAAVAGEKMLEVTTRWQQTGEWCWAASGEMLMEYIGQATTPPHEVPQCYEANEAFGRTDCCHCPTPGYVSKTNQGCVRPGWPQFNTWHYNSTTTSWGTALTWNQVTQQINSGKPFMFSWAWHGGGAHAMVGVGYNQERILVPSDFEVLSPIKKVPTPVIKGQPGPELYPVVKLRPGHIIYRTLDFVMVNNPWPPQGRCGNGNASGPFGGDFQIVTYAAFVGGPSYDHDHGSDIYNISHK